MVNAAEAGVPGILRRTAGISPEKIATELMAIIMERPARGSIKYVNGIRRAVAIVAVRPGMDPTKTPNNAARNIVTIIWG
jgi:hypothetical protein